MKCSSCGVDNSTGSQFCIGCGKPLAAAFAPPAAGQAAQGIELLPGEEVVMTLSGLALTNRRVVYQFTPGCLKFGGADLGAAMLEDIDSTAVVRRRLLGLLILGCALLAVGVVGGAFVVLVGSDGMVTNVVSFFGVLFILAYFLIPVNILILTVSGSPFVRQMLFSLGSGGKNVEQFVNRLFAMKAALRPEA